ncbi:helix-loop-helix protein 6-like [Ischnura elegans]|uniref:helix-loop-helix protein 6-like n=1 Tax=Ischnura elegans TaxID=197161 RepID=UPI001ED8AB9A|nr:helix-loop-helix protein 6-like [Ischnura elegans]
MFAPGYSWETEGADSGGSGGNMDPFSPENRIPLPSEAASGGRGGFCWRTGVVAEAAALAPSTVEPPCVRKRNERERERVRSVNEGFERLKRCLPADVETKRKAGMSKVEVLREAIVYIRNLEEQLKRRNRNSRIRMN